MEDRVPEVDEPAIWAFWEGRLPPPRFVNPYKGIASALFAIGVVPALWGAFLFFPNPPSPPRNLGGGLFVFGTVCLLAAAGSYVAEVRTQRRLDRISEVWSSPWGRAYSRPFRPGDKCR